MALTEMDWTSEVAAAAMLDGFKRMLKDQLKEEVLADMDPIIEKAIAAAVESFEVTLQSNLNQRMDMMSGRELMVRLILERKTKVIHGLKA